MNRLFTPQFLTLCLLLISKPFREYSCYNLQQADDINAFACMSEKCRGLTLASLLPALSAL